MSDATDSRRVSTDKPDVSGASPKTRDRVEEESNRHRKELEERKGKRKKRRGEVCGRCKPANASLEVI